MRRGGRVREPRPGDERWGTVPGLISVEVVDALPLNASGKVLKTELRRRARAVVGGSRV